MAGVKGAGGPVPKRSDQRRRRNAPARPVKKVAGERKDGRAPVNAKWHPVAKRWYSSLGESRQSVFYEPSDWSLAYLLAESISRELSPHPVFNPLTGEKVADVVRPPKGASLAAWLKGMSSLLVSEGDRRRLQIELDTPSGVSEETGSVSSIDAWRGRTSGTG